MSLNLHFLHFHLDFFPVNMGSLNVSISIYPEWETDTAADRTQIYWLITAGRLYGGHQQKNTETTNDKMSP